MFDETNSSSLYVLFFKCFAPEFQASSHIIDDTLLSRMKYSWREESPVPLEDLRYLILSHWDFEGNVQQGELVVHCLVADEVIEIFEKLFEIQFPLTCMKLADAYEADDDASMDANNCYAHCARNVAHTNIWSNHAYGLAIDINPQQNPLLRGDEVFPKTARENGYIDRENLRPGMITQDTSIYKIFTSYGWMWGGECFKPFGFEDLHHFQKVIPGLNNLR